MTIGILGYMYQYKMYHDVLFIFQRENEYAITKPYNEIYRGIKIHRDILLNLARI